MDKYLKFYAKYGFKRTNEGYYKDKKDYLKLKITDEEDLWGYYDHNQRSVYLSTSLGYDDALQLIQINATIVHEFGHGLFRDVFEGSDFVFTSDAESVGNIEIPQTKERALEELFMKYLEYLEFGATGVIKSDMSALFRINMSLSGNTNPLDVINMIYPFRDKLKINVEGLKKINLDHHVVSMWLSQITNKSVPELREMVV
jgi:hypothetical protein